jgi:hypothetical protein
MGKEPCGFTGRGRKRARRLNKMKLTYCIQFWGNGSCTSGTIESRFTFLAKRKLRKMLKRGFRSQMGFSVRPKSIDNVFIEIER